MFDEYIKSFRKNQTNSHFNRSSLFSRRMTCLAQLVESVEPSDKSSMTEILKGNPEYFVEAIFFLSKINALCEIHISESPTEQGTEQLLNSYLIIYVTPSYHIEQSGEYGKKGGLRE